jgi:hypothetical protein
MLMIIASGVNASAAVILKPEAGAGLLIGGTYPSGLKFW